MKKRERLACKRVFDIMQMVLVLESNGKINGVDVLERKTVNENIVLKCVHI